MDGPIKVRRFRIPLLSTVGGDGIRDDSIYVVYGIKKGKSFADVVKSIKPPMYSKNGVSAVDFPRGKLLTRYDGTDRELGKVRRHGVRHAIGLLDGIRKKDYSIYWGPFDLPLVPTPLGMLPYLLHKAVKFGRRVFGY